MTPDCRGRVAAVRIAGAPGGRLAGFLCRFPLLRCSDIGLRHPDTVSRACHLALVALQKSLIHVCPCLGGTGFIACPAPGCGSVTATRHFYDPTDDSRRAQRWQCTGRSRGIRAARRRCRRRVLWTGPRPLNQLARRRRTRRIAGRRPHKSPACLRAPWALPFPRASFR